MQKACLYKYTLIIQALLFPLTTFIIFLLPNPEGNIIYKWAKLLFGTDSDFLAASVFFLLVPALYLVLSFIGALIVSSIVSADKLPAEVLPDELSNRKRLRKQNFWKFSFYANVLLAICALACLFIIMGIGKHHMYYTDASNRGSVFTWVLVAAIGITTSFILGGLLLGISAIWQTSKTASLLNIVVALVTFMIPFFIVGLWLFNASLEKPGNNPSGIASTVPEGYQEYEEESIDDSEEKPEGEKPIPNYLSSLWNSPDEDRENIIGAMNYVLHESGAKQPSSAVDMVRNNLPLEKDIPSYATGIPANYLKIADYIGRDGGKLKAAFNSYKDILYTVVTSDIYYQSAPQRMVDGLISAYESIHGRTDEESVWLGIYSIMKDGGRLTAGEYYDDLEEYISEDVLKIFTAKNTDAVKADAVWAYSFWARRYKEGNSKEVYEILLEIQQHYESD